ncbi:MAG TPA: D-glycero-beta-D-manno-heptose 1-phosphate adenylyltransferase, partial [Pirellulales bacterium]|nr:D-glycero-beta-D-manno-heptose 1-phosphate adenylyltransferase [Pirellulales bacterium]
MNAPFAQLIERLAKLRVLVIGEAMLDCYLEGSTTRICQEAPVPIVAVERRTDAPGGAANSAVNAAALGAEVRLISAIGDDCESEVLRQALEKRGVESRYLIACPHRRTLMKQRIVASSQVLLRCDQGETAEIDRSVEQRLISQIEKAYAWCDVVMISDYGYGVITPAIVAALAKLRSGSRRIMLVDSKRLPIYRRLRPTVVKPNYREALDLLAIKDVPANHPRIAGITAERERILNVTGAQIAAVTLDCEGALIFERGAPPYRTYAIANRNSRAAGAGDTYLCALGMAVAAGAETVTAAELASTAAAVVVCKDGTSACTADALRDSTAQPHKLLSGRRLREQLGTYRRRGKRIVLTNGCFDILHRGHIAFLNRAKTLGDVLVVGVNSDLSIQRLKGPDRPINRLDDRLQVLAALSSVDHVTAFSEDTPIELIGIVRPDVFVKGGDYAGKTLPEAECVERAGGVVHILPYIAESST